MAKRSKASSGKKKVLNKENDSLNELFDSFKTILSSEMKYTLQLLDDQFNDLISSIPLEQLNKKPASEFIYELISNLNRQVKDSGYGTMSSNSDCKETSDGESPKEINSCAIPKEIPKIISKVQNQRPLSGLSSSFVLTSPQHCQENNRTRKRSQSADSCKTSCVSSSGVTRHNSEEIILPKLDLKCTISLLRRPRKFEKLFSVNGSPIVVPEPSCQAQLVIPVNGTELYIFPEADPKDIPEIDVDRSQLEKLLKNMTKLLERSE